MIQIEYSMGMTFLSLTKLPSETKRLFIFATKWIICFGTICNHVLNLFFCCVPSLFKFIMPLRQHVTNLSMLWTSHLIRFRSWIEFRVLILNYDPSFSLVILLCSGPERTEREGEEEGGGSNIILWKQQVENSLGTKKYLI